MTGHFTGHFSFVSSCSAPRAGRHGRQSWDSADRRTLRRKGKEVVWSKAPVFWPPGKLVVSEVPEGHRAHKKLLQTGG